MEGTVIWVVAAPEDATSGADGKGSGAVEKASDAVVTVSSGSDGMGGGEDMIGTELPDTKVLGARVLPVLRRRL